MITTLGRLDRLQESGRLDALLRSTVRFSTKAALLEGYDAGKFPEAQTTRIEQAQCLNGHFLQLIFLIPLSLPARNPLKIVKLEEYPPLARKVLLNETKGLLT